MSWLTSSIHHCVQRSRTTEVNVKPVTVQIVDSLEHPSSLTAQARDLISFLSDVYLGAPPIAHPSNCALKIAYSIHIMDPPNRPPTHPLLLLNLETRSRRPRIHDALNAHALPPRHPGYKTCCQIERGADRVIRGGAGVSGGVQE